jgi:hypothetical protein
MGATLLRFTFRNYGIVVFLSMAVAGCADNHLPPQSVSTISRDERWNLDERLKENRERIDHAQLESDKLVAEHDSRFDFQVDDFRVSVLDGVSKLPGVISATASNTDHPTSRIIHLISGEVPSKDDFFVALKQKADGGVSQTQLNSLYDEYILQIRLMQIEHSVIVRCLVRNHGLRRIYVESITDGDFALSKNGVEVGRHGDVLEPKENSRLAVVGTTHWMKGLQGDVPSEFQDWEIKDVPHSVLSSSESIFKRFNNSKKVVQKVVYKRSHQMMDTEVRFILTDGACCLIIGDDNDFAENVNRIAEGKCEYIRIQTNCWQSTSPLDPNVWGR